jgi:hypothetical protein
MLIDKINVVKAAHIILASGSPRASQGWARMDALRLTQPVAAQAVWRF